MSARLAPERATTSTSRSRLVRGLVPSASAANASSGSTTRSPSITRRIATARSLAGASLPQEPDRTTLHCPAQIPTAVKGGQDDDVAGGKLLMQRLGCAEAVPTRH